MNPKRMSTTEWKEEVNSWCKNIFEKNIEILKENQAEKMIEMKTSINEIKGSVECLTSISCEWQNVRAWKQGKGNVSFLSRSMIFVLSMNGMHAWFGELYERQGLWGKMGKFLYWQNILN